MNYKNNIKKIIYVFVCAFCIMVSANNTIHAESNTVTVQIPVYCVGENTDENFKYKLEGGGSVAETMDVTELTIKDGQSDNFKVTYTVPGTYHYTVSQEEGTDDKTTYDKNVYQVDVYVTVDNNNNMYAEPIIYIDGEKDKKEKLEFVNTREEETTPPSVNPPGGDVKTGDEAPILQLVVVLMTSLLGITFTLLYIRKEKENAKQ